MNRAKEHEPQYTSITTCCRHSSEPTELDPELDPSSAASQTVRPAAKEISRKLIPFHLPFLVPQQHSARAISTHAFANFLLHGKKLLLCPTPYSQCILVDAYLENGRSMRGRSFTHHPIQHRCSPPVQRIRRPPCQFSCYCLHEVRRQTPHTWAINPFSALVVLASSRCPSPGGGLFPLRHKGRPFLGRGVPLV